MVEWLLGNILKDSLTIGGLSFWELYAFIGGIVAILSAIYMAWEIIKAPAEDEGMLKIYEAIREGARAFLTRQYKTISYIAIIITVILYLIFDLGPNNGIPYISLGFVLGALASLAAGWISMDVATRANVRAAYGAKIDLRQTLKIAFYGGMVMGLFNVGLSLLGILTLYFLFNKDPVLIVGFGFGASLAALFAQLGGGIYTKAADIGADLVGKVEAGIPEDDPRNPAVIADNVGDNVGDVAGRGADLFESMSAENIGAMIIGVALALLTKNYLFIIFPLLARATGIFATLLGTLFVKGDLEKNPFIPLRNGMIATTVFAVVGFYFLVLETLGSIYLYGAALAGIISSILILLITDYYTGYHRRPVRDIASASETGPATNILMGMSVGYESTALPVIVIVAALVISYFLGEIFATQVGINPYLGGVYGTAAATMGMLSVAGMVLGLDGFGPIVDNAGGITEMSNQPDEIRDAVDKFDAVGNTTKALTKGYAMGSAGLAALLLFQAYLDIVDIHILDLLRIENLVGVFIGGLLPFIFSAFAIRAVSKAAKAMIEEVRRQFKEIPGILEWKARPDYARCVEISTLAAQKNMIIPALVPILGPLIIGLLFGAESVGALNIGATVSGFILAMFMNTGGASWDNAKKLIEMGLFGGKGSEAHKAAVVGDTVGDPLKDTAGPSLHILIKLINTFSLVFGPLFILYSIL